MEKPTRILTHQLPHVKCDEEIERVCAHGRSTNIFRSFSEILHPDGQVG